jgi:hypothetical protein
LGANYAVFTPNDINALADGCKPKSGCHATKNPAALAGADRAHKHTEADQQEHSDPGAGPQLSPRDELIAQAREYRDAAHRQAAAALEIGGATEVALLACAGHYARRARELAMQAGRCAR